MDPIGMCSVLACVVPKTATEKFTVLSREGDTLQTTMLKGHVDSPDPVPHFSKRIAFTTHS